MTAGKETLLGTASAVRLLIEASLLPDPLPNLTPGSWLTLGKIKSGSAPFRGRGVAVITQPSDLGLAPEATGYFVPGTHCRQGDLLRAAAASARPVWIERGSFLSPVDLAHITERFSKDQEITIVESGSSFGYDDRVLDIRALALYQSWGFRVSLGLGELCLGDGATSSYRPSWATDAAQQAGFAASFLQVAALWGCGLVVKSPVLLGGAATDVAIVAASKQLAHQVCEHLAVRKH